MRKLIVMVLVFSFFLQVVSVRQVEASGKLILGIVLTGAGITAIIVGNEEVDVLKNEYDFTTYGYVGVWDSVFGYWVTEWWDFQLDPHPESITEKDKITYGWAYGTNNCNIYAYMESNHHKVYETEKRITILGKMGFVATGVGVTLLVDYLVGKTAIQQRAGLEIRTVVRPEYCGLAIARRY
jgi:hypothetical protein